MRADEQQRCHVRQQKPRAAGTGSHDEERDAHQVDGGVQQQERDKGRMPPNATATWRRPATASTSAKAVRADTAASVLYVVMSSWGDETREAGAGVRWPRSTRMLDTVWRAWYAVSK